MDSDNMGIILLFGVTGGIVGTGKAGKYSIADFHGVPFALSGVIRLTPVFRDRIGDVLSS